MPSRDAPARRPLGRGRRPQLRPPAAAQAGRPAARPHAALHPPRRVRRPAHVAPRLWASVCARSGREPGSRSTSTRTITSTARRRRVPASRSTARTRWRSPAGTARGWCWACWSPTPRSSPPTRPGAAGMGRLRVVPGVHRCLPDRCDRRRRGAGRPPLPVVALAVAPSELPHAEAFDDRVYGCDICQDVCPWNTGADRRAAEREPDAVDDAFPPLREWLEADPAELAERYRRLYIPDRDGRHLQRNARVALANVTAEADDRASACGSSCSARWAPGRSPAGRRSARGRAARSRGRACCGSGTGAGARARSTPARSRATRRRA